MPHMDTLWMDYGSGTNLQVWAIETSGYHDTIVKQYKDDHQVSFPFFSTKTNEQILDSFPISYTPWYYVICPDKTLWHVEYEDLRHFINDCITQDVVEEVGGKENFVFYSNSELIIPSSSSNEQWSLSIYNMSGQKVFVALYYTTEATNRIKINLNPGLYLIGLKSRKGEYRTQKIKI